MNEKTPLLEVHDLVVSYRHKPVLWNVDITFPTAKLIGILGPNGAGKSTLLKAMLGLLPADDGWVRFWGQPIDKHRKRIHYMPQRETVNWDFPISVEEVVMMGRYPYLGLWRRPTPADKEKVSNAIAQVGLSPFSQRQIGELSGGQQQRVFLARALAQEADLYLMDEPFAAVDATTEKVLLTLFKEIVAKGKTLIVVHHDLYTTKNYFDWLVLLNMRLIAAGPIEEVLTPERLKQTYGIQPTLLTQAGDLFEEKKIKPRTEIKPE